MDAVGYQDLQEALLWFFGPALTSAMFVLIAGGVLSAIGVIVLGLANRLSR